MFARSLIYPLRNNNRNLNLGQTEIRLITNDHETND